MSSIRVGKYRRGTHHELEFPTLPSVSIMPNRIELRQKMYSHDVLILKFAQTSPRWFSLMKTGVPIKFNWTQGTESRSWVGYVSFISKEVASQLASQMEIHCVGSTFPLKDRASKVFSNTTISSAVKSIVENYGFSFVGEDDGLVFDQLTIAGHSYWEWIVEQAKRIGYGVLVDNMTFYFRPLDKLLDQNFTSVPVLSQPGNQMGVNNQFLDKTLDWFKVLNGEYIEEPTALRTTKQVSGVDPATGKIVSANSSPALVGDNIRQNSSDVLFSEIRSDRVVSSYSVAKKMADGAAHLSRMNLPALVNCQGDPRMSPFAPILIQDTGDLTDGYWIIQDVKHMFDRLGGYQIEMKIATDGTGVDRVTTTRQGTNDVVGVVNLTEAMKSNGSSSVPSKSVVLYSKNPLLKEDDQGFLRTPNRWISSNVGAV